VAYGIKMVVPKTFETTRLLERWIYRDPGEAEAAAGIRDEDARGPADPRDQRQGMVAGARESEREVRHRSVAWIIGTSLAFEAVAVGLAAWIFCRRDY
jgi:hypothetical protein